ncbi:esterase-like activity of phytase family protein [Flavobacterium rhamnosiphilum]|uniref:Esterase-like activity of phytase family protein n=1 Tax=Flavobacterium rhamnosiphilum TaxID=2541724 RepID=A0A4R5F6F6_9FLAO|nr:esterase-like activity of phytase family protein [Flavobacterium rhamnosiphilum]TDE42917.1 esterase-like activity of phytase family protein [Flavobacterium rhamnosiphilum]
MRKLLFLVVLPAVLLSCSNLKQTIENKPTPSLRLISSIEIPFDKTFQNTKVGGLSGIDYDAKNDLYYLISDERSQTNDSRFYTAKIRLVENKLESIDFTAVITLKNEAGENYGNWNTIPSTSADPEDIRFNPKTNSLIWSSEGAHVLTADKTVLQNPSINFMDLKGDFLGNVTLPENLKMQKLEKGPRNNGTLEGITFDKNYKNIYTNIEEPLFEDGDQANTSKGGLIRLYQFNAKTKNNTAQYGYQLEPIAHEPSPKEAFAVNGISAIQYYGKNQLLVVERSYSTGTQTCTVKVFLCDLKKATNVKNYPSLQNQKLELASKKLILNMDDLGIFIDNIEGLTFGPKLTNGNPSIIFVSDNNFSDKQKTQVLVFELMK